MSYTTSGISYLGAQVFDGGRIERYSTTHTDKVIQLYVSGELYGWAEPDQGVVEFHIPDTSEVDVIFPLAVDRDNSDTDYWSDAFPEAAAHGNKIKIQTPQLMKYGVNDKWKVYRGDAGDEAATLLIREQDLYPGGRRASGFGLGPFGYGGFGWDGSNAKGFGYNFGYGEFGFDCDMLEHITEALPPGDYPAKIIIEDEHGNESTAATDTVTLDTYARPASALDVESYDEPTDALELSWTASPDVT